MKEKVILLEYSFGTVFHEDGVEEDACYIYAARAYGKKTRLLGSRGEEMVREGREELLECTEGNGGEAEAENCG